MDVAGLVAALQVEGEALAAAAAGVAPEAAVPTCPEWCVRDLVRHLGQVHRWAAWHLTSGETGPMPDSLWDSVVGPDPTDEKLTGWFADGHAALVSALQRADPALPCWSFLPAPSPVAFWARRQAHETGMHRVDVEAAAGTDSGGDPQVAADGVDELLTCFLPRRHMKLRRDVPATLTVRTTDTGDRWRLTVSDEPVAVVRGDGTASDCTVAGRAVELFRFLWNRRGPEGLVVDGDASLLDLWRDRVRVRWS